MIGFADTVWEIFSLAGVFLAGLMVMPRISQWLQVSARHAMALYVWHTFFCLVYIWYSLNNPADSLKYFLDSLHWDSGPMLGGRSVIFVNSLLTQFFGLSYGGCFFVFNIFGSIGLIAFSAAIRAMLWNKSRWLRGMIIILPFLPGFSFWTTAIGKDSIAFFGVGLICWAAASPYRRFPTIVIGFAALLTVRPHMAAVLLAALSFAFLLASKLHLARKLLISAILVPTTITVFAFSLSYVGLDSLSVDRVDAFVDQRQAYNTQGGSSVDIASSSPPMRLFMYAFRPLFFDAGGVFGLVVSLENLVLFVIFLSFLSGLIRRRSNLTRFQKVFFFLYAAISWIVLANTTANLGIAIRQKTMFTPMLLLIMLSYMSSKRLSRGNATQSKAPTDFGRYPARLS